ncbi:MAG: short-chain dehydrogenase [Verrucomicrobia bacterium]|nr:MAG: short-chain dehydrogenase [Verrucomicrobiota bacterium]
MRGLKGKKAIVTGGAQGIGRACVEAFLEHGAAVTFGDLEEETGSRTVEELSPKGEIHFVPGDMAEEKTCIDLVAKASDLMGGVDFLINNAFSFIAAGPDATREDWCRSVEAGPIAFATMIQHVTPVMKERGGGAIVNMASISAHIAQAGRWTYNASKGAVIQITRCAALDYGAFGIRVNTLSPGWVWTREVLRAADFDQEKWEPIWGKYHMLRRLGRASEVATAAMFLCSDEASFITGSELPVDGGYGGLGSEGLGETSEFAGSS